jgi:hypothetical protein
LDLPSVSISRWMEFKKVVNVHIMDYYSTINKNERLSFVTTWLNLEDVILSEIIQAQREKYCMLSLIFEMYKIWFNRSKETSDY